MNRQEFFRRLEYLLRAIPENERMDALAYYNDYFDDAGIENEQQVIRELGSPEAVAQMILDDYYSSQQNQSTYTKESNQYGRNKESKNENTSGIIHKIKNMSRSNKILIIILLVFTFPIWIGIVAGLFGVIVGLLGGLFGIVVGAGGAGIGMLLGGFGCLTIGVLRVLAAPAEGIVAIGIGALFVAIGVLLLVLCVQLIFKWIPIILKAIVKWTKGLLNGQKGDCEL